MVPPSPSRRWPDRLKTFTLVPVSLLFSLLLLECVLRIADGLPLLPADNLILARADRFTRRTETVYDPQLGWVLRANQATIKTRLYPSLTTGEHGVRMNQGEIRPLPMRAVLAVGDSFTQGSEVDDASTWPAQLERTLATPVVNGGVGGYGSDQIVLRAESLLRAVDPQTLIVSFLSSDILRAQLSTYFGAAKPYFLARDGQLVAMNQPVPPPGRRTGAPLEFPRNLLGHSYLLTWTMARTGNGWWFDTQRTVRVPTDYVAVACLMLERLKRDADARKVRVIFMMQWPGDEIANLKQRPIHATAVLDCAAALGLQVIDAWDSLQAVAARGKDGLLSLYHHRGKEPFYMHMSPAGNALVADLAARAVRDPGYMQLPPPTRRDAAPSMDLDVLGESAVINNVSVAHHPPSALLLQDRGPPMGSIFQDIAVDDDNRWHRFALDVKAGGSSTAQILLAYLGGEQRVYYAMIEAGSMAVHGDGLISANPLADGWWRVTLAGGNNATGNRTLRVQVFPSLGHNGAPGTLMIRNPRLDP